VTTAPTIILCGGQGSRMRDLAQTVPKPMLPIGGRPILWHIMKLYAAGGCTDFVLALGYLREVIQEFVLHFAALTSDFRLELGRPESLEFFERHREQGWRIACVDTGLYSQTGTRVKLAARRADGDRVMVTYGDCVGDIDVQAVLDFHLAHGKLATVTAVRPPGRFGELAIDDGDTVVAFEEKPQTSTGAINGGFMVFEREAIERYIPDDDVMLEREPMAALAKDGELMAFEHNGFWQPMDTPREHELLEDLWRTGDAPWAR
jgi:glucose-1-phosphate cytidylyltransferase